MLFTFSLDGKAARWLNSLPTGSLTSWEQVQSAFLSSFYTKARTTALRNKITSSRQLTDEAFCDAWERYNDYRRECPHHIFDDDYFLRIFYDGVDWEYRSSLNSSSNGDFMIQTTDEAFKVIENMAASLANKNQESGRSKKFNSVDNQNIDKLTANVDQLLKSNQEKCFSMEEVTAGQIQNTQEVAPEAEKKENDQQGFPQNFQGKTFIFSQAQNRFVGQNQNQNQQKPQSNQQVVPAAGNGQPDELKGLGMMMQQLSEGSGQGVVSGYQRHQYQV